MRGISNAEQPRAMPLFQSVQLHREQLDLLPIVQFVNTIREIWGNARNHLAERFHSSGLDLFKRILTDDQPGLKVVTSVDENESPAVIDVAEQLFRVIIVPPNAKP